jgi:hypothetical protein
MSKFFVQILHTATYEVEVEACDVADAAARAENVFRDAPDLKAFASLEDYFEPTSVSNRSSARRVA